MNVNVDIEHCDKFISAIIGLEILEKPDNSLVGLKWKETRLMFGKEASETMWITEAVENDYYCTRAESHGSVYLTKMAVSEAGKNTKLSMSFRAEAQSTLIRIISSVMSVFIKGSMKKALCKDLEDIKEFVESS